MDREFEELTYPSIPIQVLAVCSVAEVCPEVGMAGSGTSKEAETPVISLPVTTAPAQDSLYSTSAVECAVDVSDDEDDADAC